MIQKRRAPRAFRDAYRAALGVLPGQKLVLLTTTRGEGSLLGGAPDTVRRMVAELPRDAYRCAAAAGVVSAGREVVTRAPDMAEILA
ncbi:hypothetical protein [Streptomyces clavuligerus]|uniref:hypothetical protein n=1 Tax=Streptomyces clavuligerus TaxID=1901 RepID=UPI0018D03C15|nr:hypothetical protein [Streptomyces clavuligerus]